MFSLISGDGSCRGIFVCVLPRRPEQLTIVIDDPERLFFPAHHSTLHGPWNPGGLSISVSSLRLSFPMCSLLLILTCPHWFVSLWRVRGRHWFAQSSGDELQQRLFGCGGRRGSTGSDQPWKLQAPRAPADPPRAPGPPSPPQPGHNKWQSAV